MMKAAVVGWMAVIATLSGPVPAQKANLDWIIRDDLEAGKILIDFGSDEHYTEHIRAAVLIDAPAEKIWAILKDCERAPKHIPHVQACELLETPPDERTLIFRQRVKLTWFLPSFEPDFPIPRFVISHMLTRNVPAILTETQDRTEAAFAIESAL